MKNKYSKLVNKRMGTVNIMLHPSSNEFEAFIDLFVDDEELNLHSPFKDIESCEGFADIIIKLLERVT